MVKLRQALVRCRSEVGHLSSSKRRLAGLLRPRPRSLSSHRSASPSSFPRPPVYSPSDRPGPGQDGTAPTSKAPGGVGVEARSVRERQEPTSLNSLDASASRTEGSTPSLAPSPVQPGTERPSFSSLPFPSLPSFQPSPSSSSALFSDHRSRANGRQVRLSIEQQPTKGGQTTSWIRFLQLAQPAQPGSPVWTVTVRPSRGGSHHACTASEPRPDFTVHA